MHFEIFKKYSFLNFMRGGALVQARSCKPIMTINLRIQDYFSNFVDEKQLLT